MHVDRLITILEAVTVGGGTPTGNEFASSDLLPVAANIGRTPFAGRCRHQFALPNRRTTEADRFAGSCGRRRWPGGGADARRCDPQFRRSNGPVTLSRQVRARGYAECVEEIEVGVASVAVPICVGDVGALFSVGAIGPVRRFTKKHRAKVGQELLSHTASVAKALQLSGHSG